MSRPESPAGARDENIAGSRGVGRLRPAAPASLNHGGGAAKDAGGGTTGGTDMGRLMGDSKSKAAKRRRASAESPASAAPGREARQFLFRPEGGPPDPELDGYELDHLYRSAAGGDQGEVNHMLVALNHAELSDPGRLDRALAETPFGNMAKMLEHALIRNEYGDNYAGIAFTHRQIGRIRAGLAGPDPSPLEAILAERAALCWYTVNQAERHIARAEGLTIDQAAYHQRKISAAHARFLAAVKALAVVRRLALPAVQMHVEQRVNVAVGPAASTPGARPEIPPGGGRPGLPDGRGSGRNWGEAEHRGDLAEM